MNTNHTVTALMGLAIGLEVAGYVPHGWGMTAAFSLLGGALLLRKQTRLAVAVLVITFCGTALAAGPCFQPSLDGSCAFSGITVGFGDKVNFKVFVCNADEVQVTRLGGLFGTVTEDSEFSYTATGSGDLPHGQTDAGRSCTICQGKNGGGIGECFGQGNVTPTPQPTATPQPTPTRRPRMSQGAKDTLGIAVDAGKLGAVLLGAEAAALANTGKPGDAVDAAWAAAFATAWGVGLDRIQKMIDADPYRNDYAKVCQLTAQTVPAKITGPLRRKVIWYQKMEAEAARCAIITLDRAYSAEHDGKPALVERQDVRLLALTRLIGRLMHEELPIRARLGVINPRLPSIANPDYMKALEDAAAELQK